MSSAIYLKRIENKSNSINTIYGSRTKIAKNPEREKQKIRQEDEGMWSEKGRDISKHTKGMKRGLKNIYSSPYVVCCVWKYLGTCDVGDKWWQKTQSEGKAFKN